VGISFGFLLLGTVSLDAQPPGVTDREVLIGSCASLEGPPSFLGRETVNAAEACFQLVKEEGGVNGRKLRLVSPDDSYDPAKTQACRDKRMAQKVFAMGFFVGTPTAVKYVAPILKQAHAKGWRPLALPDCIVCGGRTN
jgi:branched-chain amino acid transport system substrate-binding protein